MKNRAAMILGAFNDLGIPLHPSSRIAQQIDTYLDKKALLPQVIEPNHPLFQTIVEAQRDLTQIGFALKQLRPTVPREQMKRVLQRVAQDNVLPQDNPDHSPGRDAQVELFIAGLCARAGLNPVFDERPDLRCSLATQEFGAAVKRIKVSQDQFENRFQKCVRAAANQIADSQLPGIIVIDISQSRNPTNWWVPLEVSDSQFDTSWKAYTRSFRNRFETPLLEWIQGKNVRGMILIDHVLRFPPTKVGRLELRSFSMQLSPFNQRRRLEFERFAHQFNQAVLNPGEG